MKVLLPHFQKTSDGKKVPTTVEINGLKAELDENLHFTIVGAVNENQAAELCAAHKLPVDMAQFSHEEGEEGSLIQVAYNDHGERVETVLEPPPNAPVAEPAAPAEVAPETPAAPVEPVTEPVAEPAAPVAPEAEAPSTEAPAEEPAS